MKLANRAREGAAAGAAAKGGATPASPAQARPAPAAAEKAAQRVLLQVRDLSKTYATQSGESVHALANISVDLLDGEFVSVVGPSGCGKTTLLKILAGIVEHSEGELRYAGRNGAAKGATGVDAATASTGVVFQSPVLLPWLTVVENAVLPAKIFKLDLRKYRARARELLAMVGLQGFEDKYPGELSGGMQQRAAIVRALLHDPSLLLMDEPFGALDALTRERMSLELQRIWMETRKTVVFITHSIAEAVFLSDRVLVLSPRPGRIVEELAIPFPRPRDLDIGAAPEFGRIANRIRHRLGSEGGIDG